MSKVRSGGGIQGNKNVKVGVRAGSPSTNVINPAGTRQLGNAVERETVQPLQRGSAKAATELGNALATNVGKGGPGTGRTIYGSGSQGTWGSPAQGEADHAPDVNDMSGGRDILGEFGPESK